MPPMLNLCSILLYVIDLLAVVYNYFKGKNFFLNLESRYVTYNIQLIPDLVGFLLPGASFLVLDPHTGPHPPQGPCHLPGPHRPQGPRHPPGLHSLQRPHHPRSS